MMTYKISKVENKILILAVVLFLIAVLVTQMTVLAATNDATQEATSSKATSIAIKDQAGTGEITTITFPAAASSTEVIAPYNNTDGSGSAQAFGATSLPVAWLVSATDYNLYVSVTEVSGWDTLVVDENILCSDSLVLDKATFDSGSTALSTWGMVTDMGTQTVTTTKKYLYLTVNLDSSAGISGSSTVAVLGETI